MNFLLHRHFALIELGSARAGVGAMLPDLFRLAGRKLRAPRPDTVGADPHAEAAAACEEEPALDPCGPASTPLDHPRNAALAAAAWREAGGDEIGRGIGHHFETDRWFHVGRVFREGERETAALLRALPATPPKLGLFAHVIWEMCLDGAHLRRVGLGAVLGELRAAAPRLDPEVLAALAATTAPDAAPADHARVGQRVAELWERLLDGSWLEAYCSGEGMCFPLGGVRSLFGLPFFEPAERAVLASALERRLLAAEARLDALASEWPVASGHAGPGMR
ncbi:MAG: hypothetical protein HY908_33705 [Myxococcales bacterium]|nr:hypothetical protein [Myxococcales bacterium]